MLLNDSHVTAALAEYCIIGQSTHDGCSNMIFYVLRRALAVKLFHRNLIAFHVNVSYNV